MDLTKEELVILLEALRVHRERSDEKAVFDLWLKVKEEIRRRKADMLPEQENRYRVVYRNSSVVFDEIVYARTMVGAATQAQEATEDKDSLYFNWSVYSITLV